MYKKTATLIILLTIFASYNKCYSQLQIGKAYNDHGVLIIDYGEMKVYKTYDDYVNKNFVIADDIKGKDFRKEKEKVVKVSECWGYSVEYNSSTYLFRICEDCGATRLLLTNKGSICLYFDAEPYYDPKKKQMFILLFGLTEPMYFSVSESGPVQKFNRKNISEAVKGDGTSEAQAGNIKNVTSNSNDYIPPRLLLVQGYNKRHPAENEFDLFATPSRHGTKKN